MSQFNPGDKVHHGSNDVYTYTVLATFSSGKFPDGVVIESGDGYACVTRGERLTKVERRLKAGKKYSYQGAGEFAMRGEAQRTSAVYQIVEVAEDGAVIGWGLDSRGGRYPLSLGAGFIDTYFDLFKEIR